METNIFIISKKQTTRFRSHSMYCQMEKIIDRTTHGIQDGPTESTRNGSRRLFPTSGRHDIQKIKDLNLLTISKMFRRT